MKNICNNVSLCKTSVLRKENKAIFDFERIFKKNQIILLRTDYTCITEEEIKACSDWVDSTQIHLLTYLNQSNFSNNLNCKLKSYYKSQGKKGLGSQILLTASLVSNGTFPTSFDTVHRLSQWCINLSWFSIYLSFCFYTVFIVYMTNDILP